MFINSCAITCNVLLGRSDLKSDADDSILFSQPTLFSFLFFLSFFLFSCLSLFLAAITANLLAIYFLCDTLISSRLTLKNDISAFYRLGYPRAPFCRPGDLYDVILLFCLAWSSLLQ